MKKFLLQKITYASGLHPQIKYSTLCGTYDECYKLAEKEGFEEYQKNAKLSITRPGDLTEQRPTTYQKEHPVICIFNAATDEMFAWFITELDV